MSRRAVTVFWILYYLAWLILLVWLVAPGMEPLLWRRTYLTCQRWAYRMGKVGLAAEHQYWESMERISLR